MVESPYKNSGKLTGGAYVFVSAQNNTNVHRGFLGALETFINENDAELIVGTFTYNKNGFQNSSKDDDLWYDPLITKYIRNESLQVTDDLVWNGELNIIPTATNPLSGFDIYNRTASGIFPSCQVRLKSCPTKKNDEAKMMYATGCVTTRNYIEKKAGQKAARNFHSYAALYVTIQNDGTWFAYQIHGDEDTGDIMFMDAVYTKDGMTVDYNKNIISAINWGDIHTENSDDEEHEINFDILDTLNPLYQFMHDTISFNARNHHNINDHLQRFKMYHEGNDSVLDDLEKATDLLKSYCRSETETIVVRSNHDEAIEKWLCNQSYDFRKDPQNALIYLQLQMEMLQSIAERRYFNAFEYSVKELMGGHYEAVAHNLTFLRKDQSFVVSGIEFGHHGHLGSNGSKGSPDQFAKMGEKTNTGHTHVAGIIFGSYTSGVTGDVKNFDYANGPCSWSFSHIVTHINGSRTILTVKRNKKTGKYQWNVPFGHRRGIDVKG